jgi:hypothetical protein
MKKHWNKFQQSSQHSITASQTTYLRINPEASDSRGYIQSSKPEVLCSGENSATRTCSMKLLYCNNTAKANQQNTLHE